MLEFLNPFEEKRQIYQGLSIQTGHASSPELYATSQEDASPSALTTESFNPDQVTEAVIANFTPRMKSAVMTSDVAAQTRQFMAEYGRIACRLLIQEPGYAPAGTGEWIPFDVPLAQKTVELFAHGIFHTSLKCENLGIFDEMKRILMEAVALDIFQQAKNIVVATMNQVETPELQIPLYMQAEWIEQTADNSLVYYLSHDDGTTDGDEAPQAVESYDCFEALELGDTLEFDSNLGPNSLNNPLENPAMPSAGNEIREGSRSGQGGPDATSMVPLGHWIRLIRFLAEQEEHASKESSQKSFQPEALAQEVTSIFYERLFDGMVQNDLDEDAIQEVANHVFDFTVIAARFIKENVLEDSAETDSEAKLVQQVQQVQVEEGGESISFDLYTAKKSLLLFAEGVFHIALKSQLMSIPGSIRKQLMKEVSYEIYLETLRVAGPPTDQPFTQPNAIMLRTGPEAMNYFKRQVAWMKEKAEGYLHQALTSQMNTWLSSRK